MVLRLTPALLLLLLLDFVAGGDSKSHQTKVVERWRFPEGGALASTLHAARILHDIQGCPWGDGPPYPPAVNVTLDLPAHDGGEGERGVVRLTLVQNRVGRLPADDHQISTYKSVGDPRGRWARASLLPNCAIHSFIYEPQGGLTIVDAFDIHRKSISAHHGRILNAPNIVAYRAIDMMPMDTHGSSKAQLSFFRNVLLPRMPARARDLIGEGGKINDFKQDKWNLKSNKGTDLSPLKGCPTHRQGNPREAKYGVRLGFMLDYTFLERYGGKQKAIQKLQE